MCFNLELLSCGEGARAVARMFPHRVGSETDCDPRTRTAQFNCDVPTSRLGAEGVPWRRNRRRFADFGD